MTMSSNRNYNNNKQPNKQQNKIIVNSGTLSPDWVNAKDILTPTITPILYKYNDSYDDTLWVNQTTLLSLLPVDTTNGNNDNNGCLNLYRLIINEIKEENETKLK